MTRQIHVFDNGVMVYDDQLIPVQRERYRQRNVHEAEEEDLFVNIVRALPPGGRYLDIGSAIGYYPLLAKRLAPRMVVDVVEPLRRHRDFFQENIRLNGLPPDEFAVHSEGIASSNGEAQFVDDGYASAVLAHGRAPGTLPAAGVATISTKTLDCLIAEMGDAVDLCQMDVQGLELDVLRGAPQVLRSGGVRTFLIGTHGEGLHRDCLALLRDNGYLIEFEEHQTTMQPDGIIVASKGVRRLSAGGGPLQAANVVNAQSAVASGVKPPATRTFYPESYAYYRELSDACQAKSAVPFVLLDSKSLPRSGLHYLKKTLGRLLGDHFSFCEWYHDPGCCKKMPCALTGFAEQSVKQGIARLRLVKSHDFDLEDPIFPPIYSVRRVILVRDPLYLLTSWFALDQLDLYEQALCKANINLVKISLHHEPELLASAYQIMDEAFVTPDAKSLTAWLEEKAEYVIGFLDKWVRPALENPQPFLHVVQYEEINAFIATTLEEMRDYLPEDTKKRIDTFVRNSGNQFQARQNPFHAPSKKLANYLSENAAAFEDTAKKILAASTLRATAAAGDSAPRAKRTITVKHPDLPKISIVTPSFNQAQYLEECIDSVLSQNYPNLEYIIMDGGSTDGSAEIIKKHAKRLAYWQSKADGGQYRAIDAGFRRSTGEIMAWLNSDDKYHSGAFNLVELAFRAMPQAEWLTGRPTAWDDQGSLSTVFDHVPSWSPQRLLAHASGDFYIQQESTFWRRSLWERAGGNLDTNLGLAADFELWCRFFRHAQLVGVDALLGGFRYHQAQKTGNLMDSYEQEVLRIIDREKQLDDRNKQPYQSLRTIGMEEIIAATAPELTPESFPYFTYSRRPHFAWFRGAEHKLFGSQVDMDACDLKRYQDLLCYCFITDNILKGGRILEIGGADSRVLKALKNDYECWNIDKLEGLGNGVTRVSADGYKLISAYMGEFSTELPDGYFDLVFSISVLEHVKEDDRIFEDIRRDIDRVMKPGAFSLHCFDVVEHTGSTRTNRFLPFLFNRIETINSFTPFEQMRQDPFTYFMTETAYKGWEEITKRSYQDFGKPLSYNVLWRKGAHLEAGRKAVQITASEVVIATSLAPRGIEPQKQALGGWIRHGFKVVSVNSAQEIAQLKDHFPEVTFVAASRNGQGVVGRPLIFMDDLLAALSATEASVCGIVNSDIHLPGEPGLKEFLVETARNSMVFGHRVDVQSLQQLTGDSYRNGFDYFFFDRSLAGCIPRTELCLGAPWWDIWFPLAMMLTGAETKRLTTTVAYHVLHDNNWSEQEWHANCRRVIHAIADAPFDMNGQAEFVAAMVDQLEKPDFIGFYNVLRDKLLAGSQPVELVPAVCSESALRSRERALAKANEIDWFHRIDLGNGIVTPGKDDSQFKLRHLGMPQDLTGKAVLDIGTWDGFFSFAAERRGAARVVALDSRLQPGFGVAKEIIGSKVQPMEMDLFDISPQKLGTFDLVLFLGVFYHLKHPLLALEKVFAVTGGLLILETYVDMLDYPRPAMAFYPGADLNSDPSNWCGPNPAMVIAMLKTVGFRKAEIFGDTFSKNGGYADNRAIFHAWR